LEAGNLAHSAPATSFAKAALLIAAGAIGLAGPQTPPPAASAQPVSPVPAVVNRYCIGCHNSKSRVGNFTLDTIVAANPSQHPEEWEKVIRKLRVRYMPPVGLPRPDEKTYDAVVASLEASLDREALAHPNPGRTDTFRRLNRAEYQNAIRDLLALDVDVSAILPSDEAGHGFDNVTVGNLSPTLLEQYLQAAQKISRLAVGIIGKSPGGDTMTLPPDLTQEQQFDDQPLGTHGGMVVRYTFPQDGDYDLSVRLQRDRNEHVEGIAGGHDVEVMLDRERVKLVTVKPPPPGNDHSGIDKDLTFRIAVKAGPHTVAATFPRKSSSLLESGRQPYQAHFNNDRHPRITPAIYSISIHGPYDAKGPGDTPSRRRLFVCQPAAAGDEDACAKRIFSTLARRAYRRPVTAADLQVPMKFYKEARNGASFDAGIEMGLRAVLVSPEFLFRIEQDPSSAAPNSAYRISDVELASRLSFFLWSSIPDDELLDTAIQGKLRSPGMLERQVRRMLADQRSETLVTNFAGQWLYLRNLAAASPDMRTFPGFDDNLRQAFRRETELFFDSIMREDRNVLDLLRANYTFLNERLAKHYGIPNVYGSRFRRVDLSESDHRGGLLSQGSILTVTSYANRTSPVIRGKWVLANLLGVAPPPKPASGVPPLKETAGVEKAVSMRERMAQHRADPACAGCHALMDPVGFSMENYDAIGRWRTAESGKPIDAAGALPDGSKFEGIAGLQEALLSRPEAFINTMTEKLLTYSLGRGVEFFDAPAVRKIVQESRGHDYRFSSMVLGIVNSTPFQMRRAQ
jgi:mono/diheme cytochrome c family protein